MIKIKFANGPRKDELVEMPVDANPDEVLANFLKEGIIWKICFCDATRSELMAWGQADMMSRCARALVRGRTVEIQGKKLKLNSTSNKNLKKEVEKVCIVLVEIIENSKKWVFIQREDERGVVIGLAEPVYANYN